MRAIHLDGIPKAKRVRKRKPKPTPAQSAPQPHDAVQISPGGWAFPHAYQQPGDGFSITGFSITDNTYAPTVTTCGTPPLAGGGTWVVNNTSQLQSALDGCTYGDVIAIEGAAPQTVSLEGLGVFTC